MMIVRTTVTGLKLAVDQNVMIVIWIILMTSSAAVMTVMVMMMMSGEVCLARDKVCSHRFKH